MQAIYLLAPYAADKFAYLLLRSRQQADGLHRNGWRRGRPAGRPGLDRPLTPKWEGLSLLTGLQNLYNFN
jgi:hypothetical protein